MFEEYIHFGATYIPLMAKVRNAIDFGAGSGSFALLLNQMSNIQSLSAIFPD